jgi:glycosyltransferase involved in cell wall biosynthesis
MPDTQPPGSTAPLVAIVTPVYNGAAYLAETMESVQKQTWPNLVHILVNNNSTDGTAEIIDRYRNGPVPVVVYKNDTTLPPMENWNLAISKVPSDAKYLRLLCADDTHYPTSTEKMVELAETDPEIGVVGCLHYCNGGVADFRWPKSQSIFDGDEALRKILLAEGVLMPVQLMMRKSVVDRRQPLYQPPLRGGFDMEAMLHLLTMSKFGFVHESLGFTRVHDESITTTQFGPATRSYTSDCLQFLMAVGEKAFGADYRAQLMRFRRYYVRRILLWRLKDGKKSDLALHFDALKSAGWTWGPALLADAMVDWVLYRLGLRQTWSGYPGWQ